MQKIIYIKLKLVKNKLYICANNKKAVKEPYKIDKKETYLIDSIEFVTPISVKILLTLLSPIIAPFYLFRKFMYDSHSIKIEVKYKQND